MKFTKMQGCGNDYVYVNCFTEEVTDPGALAVRVSNRRFGIGSDGLILIGPSKQQNFRMRMFNADGSEGEMCGNAIRCVGKYVYDKGLTARTELSVETLGGTRYLKLAVRDGKVFEVTVNMGEPVFDPKRIPVLSELPEVISDPIRVLGEEFRMTAVSMGNPHTVVFVPDTESFALEKYGPAFENHERFPQRVNTEFVEILDRSRIRMRVWERGSGETFACGTGACASVMACIRCGLTEDEVTVRMKGGDLRIRYDREENQVYMTGPAVTVFDGELYD